MKTTIALLYLILFALGLLLIGIDRERQHRLEHELWGLRERLDFLIQVSDRDHGTTLNSQPSTLNK